MKISDMQSSYLKTEPSGHPGKQRPNFVVYLIKMNKKKIIIIAFLILFLLIVVVVLFSRKEEEVVPLTQPTTTPFTYPKTSPFPVLEKPKGSSIEISDVEVENFYNKEVNTNTRGDTLFVDKGDYQIMYFAKEERFLISILGSPFDKIKGVAEKEFLLTLSINEGEACKLDVSITTPYFANPKEAGVDYKLSFCEE